MKMTSDQLENLVEIGNLERINPSKMEFDTLVNRGECLLLDARNESISIDGRFSLVYRAAHCLCTAALRWHGYKARGNRFSVFQVLTHTLELTEEAVLLSDAHRRRNRMDYEGDPFDDQRFLESMIEAVQKVLDKIRLLDPIS